MELRRFVGENRESWETLEQLLARCGQRGVGALSASELRELGLLHRKVSADLAAVRTAHPDSKVVGYLNDVAIRSHNVVYRRLRGRVWHTLLRALSDLPVAARRHGGALAASALMMFGGTLLGAIGTALDDELATLVLGEQFVQDIRDGEYWISNVFDVVPHSLASAGILTNNVSVALTVFALGFTGVLTGWILLQNGVMLGAVLVLCAEYGLLDRFIPFVVTHGAIEISAIVVAGAGGFVIFDGWLHPGDRSRMEGFRLGARDGLRVAGAAVPALLIAAPVEAFISPIETIPAALRIALGIGLAVAYWVWLLVPAPAGRLFRARRDA